MVPSCNTIFSARTSLDPRDVFENDVSVPSSCFWSRILLETNGQDASVVHSLSYLQQFAGLAAISDIHWFQLSPSALRRLLYLRQSTLTSFGFPCGLFLLFGLLLDCCTFIIHMSKFAYHDVSIWCEIGLFGQSQLPHKNCHFIPADSRLAGAKCNFITSIKNF